jgi:hypothetical protein
MLLKTNIPETTQCLAGLSVEFGDRHSLDRLILNDQATKLQAVRPIVIGNHCGHVPNDPRFYHRPENHKRRPAVIEMAISALMSAYGFPKKFLQKLLDLNPSKRRKRSERREAMGSVAQVMLHYIDLTTLRVGFYDASGKFIPLDLKYIAKKAGISVIRAKRAIADLEKAKYAKITRQFNKKEDGTFQGTPSIREVSVQFFIDLGIDIQRLFFAREWKRKKQEKERKKKTYKKLKGMLQAVTSFGGKRSFVKRPTSKKQTSFAINENKSLISTALELHKANPARTPSEYLQELQRLKE